MNKVYLIESLVTASMLLAACANKAQEVTVKFGIGPVGAGDESGTVTDHILFYETINSTGEQKTVTFYVNGVMYTGVVGVDGLVADAIDLQERFEEEPNVSVELDGIRCINLDVVAGALRNGSHGFTCLISNP